jgi:hypothetical protein
MRRRIRLLGGVVAAARPLAVRAQQRERVRRVAVLKDETNASRGSVSTDR